MFYMVQCKDFQNSKLIINTLLPQKTILLCCNVTCIGHAESESCYVEDTIQATDYGFQAYSAVYVWHFDICPIDL
jgi:hypothetical protein